MQVQRHAPDLQQSAFEFVSGAAGWSDLLAAMPGCSPYVGGIPRMDSWQGDSSAAAGPDAGSCPPAVTAAMAIPGKCTDAIAPPIPFRMSAKLRNTRNSTERIGIFIL